MSNQAGADRPFFKQGTNVPEVIAHRGGAGEWPAETIYAFEQAVDIGVDILEMDIRYTSDEELILMHDASLKETTGLDKRVEKVEYDEIKDLDAAFRWRQAGKVFPPDANLKVPRLEDVLKNKKLLGRRMNIEIKPSDFPLRLIQKFHELLKKYEMTDKVLVASGWNHVLHEFRRECPEVATSASVLEIEEFKALDKVFDWDYRPDTDAIQWYSRLLVPIITKKFVDKAKQLNLKVHGWTVNEEKEMLRLKELGIDGIITDYPSTLLRLLKRL
ncbi:MAG TPA: glycerophosphodiester phosphodiesterase [Pyrinomonadaceae bacterium]|jgi:glycerophosphoryl diester phosphodiesterase